MCVTSILDVELLGVLPEGKLIDDFKGGYLDDARLKHTTSVNESAAKRNSNSSGISPATAVVASPAAEMAPAPVVGRVVSMNAPRTSLGPTVQGTVLGITQPSDRKDKSGAESELLSLDIAGLVPSSLGGEEKPENCVWEEDPEIVAMNEKQRALKPMVGDIIVSINGIPVEHMDYSQVVLM